jgi:GxxExxY protein
MTENAIAKEIVDAAFRIHTTLGPGLLESVYDAVLAYEPKSGNWPNESGWKALIS